MKKLMILCGCFFLVILAGKPDRSRAGSNELSKQNSEDANFLQNNATPCVVNGWADQEWSFIGGTSKFWAEINYDYCCSFPVYYLWYINDMPDMGWGSPNGQPLEYTFDQSEWQPNQQYTVFCEIHLNSCGPVETQYMQGTVYSHMEIVSLTGDEDVYPDTYGNWSATVSGGSGEYGCGWYINYENLFGDGGSDAEYFFDHNEWHGEQGIHITCLAVDLVTGERDTATMYATLNDEGNKGFSELSRKTASDYLNINIAKNKIPYNVPLINKSLNNDIKVLAWQLKSSVNRITIPVSEYFSGISNKSLSIKEFR